ncbi:MAG: hypothetical protein JW936_10550 [Sedimentisphaerales bacterium]|nr:hypothetical protein [Sedimentisphaerales bacterium]
MKIEMVFPVILIVLDVAAAACYIPSERWSRVVYWLAAAVLTAAVTFERR